MTAQFTGQQPKARCAPPGQGFDAMGKPVPYERRARAYKHCKAMGMTDHDHIMSAVESMANALERDEPYAAMSEGMRHLDLTGTYRLMAVLLTDEGASK